MSDPVEQDGIEDVVSSIRKLVSVDAPRPARRREAAGGKDRLVLTPDFRVSEGRSDTAPQAVLSLTDEVSVVTAPDLDPPCEAGPDLDGPPTAADVVAPPMPQAAAPDGPPREGAAPPARRDDPDGPGAHDDGPMSLEARIAELEAAVTAQRQLFEPDGSEDQAQHRPTEIPLLADVEDDDDPRREDAADGAEAADVESDAAEVDIGAFVAEAGQGADDASAQAEVAETDSAEDVGEGSGMPPRPSNLEYLSGTRPPQAKPSPPQWDDAETVLDEAALRDLVAEIVREELQGALGERITRNVRKLVRREIMRAVSIRDFD
ncbi:hypothetical protein DXV76_07090 [Rhodobacteraceae bacterium CCMM004]|nr:hypothetical protein DXV76_07090 [Rhodobacteraceae bacterium CCMM004]